MSEPGQQSFEGCKSGAFRVLCRRRTTLRMPPISDSAEWLEADGLGGFASGTTTGIRNRRYHALLLTAATPPSGRTVLVNGFEAWIETARGQYYLSSQRYAPDVVYPDGIAHLKDFELRPWPKWHFELSDGFAVE